MTGEVVWSLDLDDGGWPVRAHEVTYVDDDRATTVCGETRTRWSHPRGWWSCRPGDAPLVEHAIHCRS